MEEEIMFLKALDAIFNPDKYVNRTDETDTKSEDDEKTETVYPPCVTKIPFIQFHLYLLIPSVLVTLAMAFTIRRKLLCPSFLGGRPGFVFAMDILGKSNRFSYAAAWGMLAYLAGDIIFEQEYAIEIEGPKYLTVVKAIISMLIYGMGYFPLFAALALESALGYVVGTAYSWMLLGVTIYQIAECPMPNYYRVNIIVGGLPKMLCLFYLCISQPVRLVQTLRKKTTSILSAKEMVEFLSMAKTLGKTVEAIHVKKLLRPPPPPPPPPTSITKKVSAIVMGFVHNWVYHKRSNFRYSSRVLSVMLIGVILIYKTTFELMWLFVDVLKAVELLLQSQLEFWGWEAIPGEGKIETYARTTLYTLYHFLIAFRGCSITSLSLAALFSLLMILHMLSSYRTNLLQLYKGDNTYIPHRTVNSNASLLVGSMKYAGFQVGYIAWGYFIMFIVLLLVSCALAVIITLIQLGIYQWLLNLLLNVWPVVAMTLLINILQILAAKFVFLQGRGEFLAINNRRVLFTFTFFMFFYNIFMGLVSCLLRIIKSVIIGTLFLCRLDNSALPMRFQLFDPGFAAYVGFIHVECVHTHPVLVVFLRILLIIQKYNTLRKEEDKKDSNSIEKGQNKTGGPRVSVKARTRWFLLYTLYNNPGIRVHRKAYIQYMNEMKERLFKHYNLNKTSLGKLVKGINKSMAPVNLSDMNIDTKDIIQPGNTALLNNMANKFIMALQMDMLRKQMGKGLDEQDIEVNLTSNILGTTNDNSNTEDTNATNGKNLWGRARLLAVKTSEESINNDTYLGERL